jgi:hypothetical protein
MGKMEKKAIDATGELISSLAKKINELNVDDIKKLAEKENATALGIIACCSGTSVENISKKTKKNKK